MSKRLDNSVAEKMAQQYLQPYMAKEAKAAAIEG